MARISHEEYVLEEGKRDFCDASIQVIYAAIEYSAHGYNCRGEGSIQATAEQG